MFDFISNIDTGQNAQELSRSFTLIWLGLYLAISIAYRFRPHRDTSPIDVDSGDLPGLISQVTRMLDNFDSLLDYLREVYVLGIPGSEEELINQLRSIRGILNRVAYGLQYI